VGIKDVAQDVTRDVAQDVAQKKEDTLSIILDEIKKNPKISRKKIAEKVGVSGIILFLEEILLYENNRAYRWNELGKYSYILPNHK